MPQTPAGITDRRRNRYSCASFRFGASNDRAITSGSGLLAGNTVPCPSSEVDRRLPRKTHAWRIAARVCRDGDRGCPQLNVAAEFADPVHPARRVAAAHKTQMHRRLETICRAITTPDHAAVIAMQIALLFDGAFMSDGRLKAFAAADPLQEAVRGILGSAATSPERATHHL
jgi:hypothetical protein